MASGFPPLLVPDYQATDELLDLNRPSVCWGEHLGCLGL
jgi:hypothetical protein